MNEQAQRIRRKVMHRITRALKKGLPGVHPEDNLSVVVSWEDFGLKDLVRDSVTDVLREELP